MAFWGRDLAAAGGRPATGDRTGRRTRTPTHAWQRSRLIRHTSRGEDRQGRGTAISTAIGAPRMRAARKEERLVVIDVDERLDRQWVAVWS